MLSLQRLLGRSAEFYGLLESSAALNCRAAEALEVLVTTGRDRPASEDPFDGIRREDKAVITQLQEMLTQVFITPMEREDLADIAEALYACPKTIGKFAQRYRIGRGRMTGVDFVPAIRMLKAACVIVKDMVTALHSPRALTEIKTLEARLGQIETDASAVVLHLIDSLCQPGLDALTAIIAQDLGRLLTRAIEDCRDAGRTLSLAVLRNA